MPSRDVWLDELEIHRRPGRYRHRALVDGHPSAEIPVLAIAGERPGPVFVAAAGVHGDEYEGPRALWEVCEALPPSSLSGVLVALPRCNPWAFAAGSRTTPVDIDGVNLARTFPGNAAGSPTERLAASLFAFVVRARPALFLDLHSGGVRYRFSPAAAGWATPSGHAPPCAPSACETCGSAAIIPARSTRRRRGAALPPSVTR